MNKHYIVLNPNGHIIDAWSDGPHPEKDPEQALCIREVASYQFHVNGVENPPMFTPSGVPRFKWDGSQIVALTEDEIQSLEQAVVREPTPEEKNEAKLDFLMSLNGMVTPMVTTFSMRTESGNTVEDYVQKYYPKLWGPRHIAKLVEAGILPKEVYERLVES